MKWNSCILTSKSWPANTLNIALLGGSASALSPFHCFPPENPMAGRYSNILQEKLQETTSNWSHHDHDNHDEPSATIHFHVHNFAQGGTDSFDNALVVDHLMDPYNTDLIIREFSVNDGLNLDVPRRRGDVTGHLDLWMARVYSLFAAAGISPPPPLLLLHLWDYDEGKHLEEMKLSGHLRDQVLQRQWDVIRHYQSIMNWDIQVINVARGINGTVVADNVEALLDDPLHPSCTANQLISSMVHYALLENIGAHCTSHSTLQQTSTPPQQQPTELKPFRPAERDPFLANPFFDAFVQGHLVARVASMSPELPHAPNVSNFNSQTMQSLALMDSLVVNSDREDYRRMDRKTFWRLPGCQEDNDKQPLQFTLHEPDLEYLAFRLTNMQRQMWFRITINNGISKDFTPDSPLSHQRFTVLWKIADILAASTRAQQYHLSFCSTIPNYGRLEGTKANGEARTERDIKQETTYLQFVVAVMRKP
ncbi:expressed unknown protein [Seminavis robusta]|uniref:Uncharacterized protein n=1 Tax=Seminavis robusta TaxID=568900 RepID=A0A9N8HIL8_9STRA|nr:expressed unknown protein [Seminavis robusta]|eukprot:Sro629_g178250.1 n/a (479) ;mRNA; f:48979-50415